MKSWMSRNNDFCKANFFLVYALCFVWHLCSMDCVELDPSAHPVGIALINYPDSFDAKMLSALSQVRTYYKKIILQTVYRRTGYKDHRKLIGLSPEERKKCFFESKPHLKLIPELVWNTHGTMCAAAVGGPQLKFKLYEGDRLNPPHGGISELMLERHEVYDAKPYADYKAWRSFYSVLPHQPPAFFKNNRDVCFHAYGGITINEKIFAHVLEYCLAPSTEPELLACMTIIDGRFIPLEKFLEFPPLIQAFLQACNPWPYRFGDSIKIFPLGGVTIPDDYKVWKQYFSNVSRYKSFKDLPKIIRKAITERYCAQKNIIKKKKSKSMGCFG